MPAAPASLEQSESLLAANEDEQVDAALVGMRECSVASVCTLDWTWVEKVTLVAPTRGVLDAQKKVRIAPKRDAPAEEVGTRAGT